MGDAYTFVTMERHSKLVLNIAMGKRDQATTDVFIEWLRHANRGEFQITTDGFVPYRTAIPNMLEDRCDFVMLIKVYRAASEGEARYSSAEVASVEKVPVMGGPDPERTCTSIVERSNLSTQVGIPTLHPLAERLLKEMGEPLGGGGAVVRALQFLPHSQIASDDASYGCRDQRPHLERAGTPGGRVRPLSETRSGCSFWWWLSLKWRGRSD